MLAKAHFSRIYDVNYWCGPESRSGIGSGLAVTTALRQELPTLLAHLGVTTVLDAGCGDYWWMRRASLNIAQYIGVDIVEAAIEQNRQHEREGVRFQCLDILHDPLPKVDLILCRDVLVHLSYDQIRAALQNFVNSGSTYVLMTTFPQHENQDLLNNLLWRPLNFQRPPFKLAAPLQCIQEQHDQPAFDDQCLGLWRLQ